MLNADHDAVFFPSRCRDEVSDIHASHSQTSHQGKAKLLALVLVLNNLDVQP
jgi:hypothetical protein